MKYFTFGEEKCYFFISKYVDYGRTYIEIDTEDGDIYCDVTVNLPFEDIPGNDYAFIDTANTPKLKEFLTENGFATETDTVAHSGYNTYHLYKLNLEKIKEYGITDNEESSLYEYEGYVVSENWDV